MSQSHVYELEYELEHEDLVALMREKWLRWTRSRAGSFVWYLALILLYSSGPLVSFLLLSLVRLLEGVPPPLEAKFFLYAVGIIASFVIFNIKTKGFKQKVIDGFVKKLRSGKYDEKFTLGHRKLTVSSGEIALVNLRGETVRKWSTVKNVKSTESHIFISSNVTFVVPRRAFDDDDDFQEFVKSITHWQGQAGVKPLPGERCA